MWSLFLRYASDEKKQPLIEKIKTKQEGVKMGSEMLDNLNSDNDLWVKYFQRMKAEADEESQLLYAEHRGKVQGKIEGTVKVIERFGIDIDEAMKVMDLEPSQRDAVIQALKEQGIAYKG